MKLKRRITSEKSEYTNLREVMDYTRPFAIFYSGVESDTYFQGCYDMGIRNFLMSYQYVMGKNITTKYADYDISLFIDSGAFTYMGDNKYLDYTEEQWEKQINQYLTWAERHKDKVFAIANLDLERLVGGDKVEEWNKKYFEPFMLRTGIPVCFIYHTDGTSMTWEQYCQRYPYVGISSGVVDDNGDLFANLTAYLKVAEKYNTLVHGMGMTKTSILPQLPFYTVDSTSWKAGFRYGKLAIWNGNKVQMFSKNDWETKALKYTRSYDLTPPLDEEKLYDFDEPEVLRANVYAYMRAEEYIIDRLKPLTYWFKKRTVKIDVDNLPDDFFPDEGWFADTPTTDPSVKEYAQKMNINPDCDEVYNIVYDMTMFLNWDKEEFETRREEYIENDGLLITELHDRFINRIVPDLDTKVEDLQNFYRECLSGENDTLLQLGTNFDRVMKERDSYIEEDDGEYVDIDPDELRERVHSLVEIPEDDEGEAEFEKLDKEIFEKAQIVPVFGEDGKFIKGQVYRRKPKKVYSAKYPKYACDTCMSAAKCPEYRSGYVCAYSKMFSRFSTRDMGDVIEAMQGMVDYNLSRMQKAMVNEVLTGVTDGTVSALMSQNMQMLNTLKQMYEAGNPEVLRHTSVIRADGTREEVTQVTNPQSGGILEKIFGGMSSAKEPEEKIVEVEESTITMNTELTDSDEERKDNDE